jgi:glycyl-radical enzyme activating protein
MTVGRREMNGRIFEIQRFSLHDGPGIRTTVFLQGCPLSCRWCHNPEGQGGKSILSFQPDRCIGCGSCFRVCPHEVHRRVAGRHVIERSLCQGCGRCARECHALVLEIVGREVTVEEVIATVLRDESFYRISGGGMTLSGGEPLAQVDFTEALLRAAKESDLHSCIETSGYADFSAFERVRPLVNLFLYDIKETDPMRHEHFTGVPHALILDNLKKLHSRGAKIRLRLPIIPGFNDREDHFLAVAALAASLPGLEGAEIVPYHPLGLSKLESLGMICPSEAETTLPEATTIQCWIRQFAQCGLEVKVS